MIQGFKWDNALWKEEPNQRHIHLRIKARGGKRTSAAHTTPCHGEQRQNDARGDSVTLWWLILMWP